jgi:XTP/dITP diphosphohydrolase
MNVIFLTGNKNKLKEARLILGDKIKLKNKKIDLDEIQSTSVEEVIKHKVALAYNLIKKPCIAEDTGVYIKNMNGFPGALIKFYLDKLGNKGISKFNGGSDAYAETIIGYHDGKKIHIFKGKVNGKISKTPKGNGFGWDPIFIPKNNTKSFSQMTEEDKNKISMRGKAFRKFRSFINKKIDKIKY